MGSKVKCKGRVLFIGPPKTHSPSSYPSHPGKKKIEDISSFDSPLGSPSLFLSCSQFPSDEGPLESLLQECQGPPIIIKYRQMGFYMYGRRKTTKLSLWGKMRKNSH